MDTDEIFENKSNKSYASPQALVPDKHKNLFDELQKAEAINKHRLLAPEEPMDADGEVNRATNKRKRSETKQFRGKESLFKRPELPLSKCLPVRQLPEFQRNPSKWTKYSLDTVRTEDISDRGNTAAALSFLRELEERKLSASEDVPSENKKPMFRSSMLIDDKGTSGTEERASFKGSKIVMPEYVVGQKKRAIRRSSTDKGNVKNHKEVKLDHLLEIEDE